MKNIILLFTLSLYFINCGKELKQRKREESRKSVNFCAFFKI